MTGRSWTCPAFDVLTCNTITSRRTSPGGHAMRNWMRTLELEAPVSGRAVRRVGPPVPAARPQVAGRRLTRGNACLRVQGVTYGPFVPNGLGEPLPAPGQVADDLARMRAAGINAVRTYHVPPEWFLRGTDEAGLAVLVDVPWAKHLCFLDSARARSDARQAVRHAAERGRHHPCILAYSVGNEVPPNIVRWHGARRLE